MRVTFECCDCMVTHRYEHISGARVMDGVIELIVKIAKFQQEHKNHDVNFYSDTMMAWNEV